ncbi:hypothetical protein [Phaeobacter sp. NW0010-22]|uniref:hypothetical protein n=1 Tax=Phaeobacter sp. NW0010-22 TaxID=3135907 RepID=UPI003103D852
MLALIIVGSEVRSLVARALNSVAVLALTFGAAKVGSAQVIDRPALALEMFETHCLSLLYEAERETVIPNSDWEALRLDKPLIGSVGTQQGARHRSSGLNLVISSADTGLESCAINDQERLFMPDEQLRFDSLVADWVQNRLPMLSLSKKGVSPIYEVFDRWIEADASDPRLLGVYLLRYTKEYSGSSILSLGFSSETPRL